MGHRFIITALFISIFFNDMQGQGAGEGYIFRNDRMDSTFFYHKKQLELAQRKNQSSLVALRHWQLGDFYYNVGIFSEAMDQFEKALQLTKSGADTLHVITKNSIGLVELSLKNYSQASHYFNETIQESIALKYIRGQAYASGYLGSCWEKDGAYDDALILQNKSLELFKSINDKSGLSLANENLGSIYEDLEVYDRAFEYFKMAHSFVKGDRTSKEVNILNNLGDVNRKRGRYNEALSYTIEALEIAKDLGDLHQLSSANKDLAKTYAEVGDFEKAFDFLNESERLNEEKFYKQNTNQFNVLQTIYETDKKEARIKLLLQENKHNRVRNSLLVTLLCSLVLLAIGIYYYLFKRRKAKLRMEEYEKLLLKTELEKRVIAEENLQNQIKLKTSALTKYSIYLSKKNKIMQDLSTTLNNVAGRKNMDVSKKLKLLAKEIDQNLKYDQEWNEFVKYFSDIHPNFMHKLSDYSEEKLSPAEMRLGMLLRLNLSSKEIAAVLRVTPDSIRVARHRLRKKLGLEPEVELIHFLVCL